jgi:hypothetical protein
LQFADSILRTKDTSFIHGYVAQAYIKRVTALSLVAGKAGIGVTAQDISKVSLP